MNILFIHQNFPAQFKFIAPALAERGHTVYALSAQPKGSSLWKGVNVVYYSPDRGSTPNIHPWVIDFETKIIRSEACLRAAIELKGNGLTPDLIIAHHGWGESLFIKEVWPDTRLGIYCEFFYSASGSDIGFDPEFSVQDEVSDRCRLQLKNLNNLLHFEIADAGISPTAWQASTFPEPFRSKITVVHDGIDTDIVAPNEDVELLLSGNIKLTKKDEVITFVSRNLEPYRGYHVFMRALPALLESRPNARVLIVGDDGVAYGARPMVEKHGEKSWKEVFISEVRPAISDADWARVHFLGHIDYKYFIPLLQLSTVHVYLTYPFVLSWSLLEAMSAGCAIVASDTQPLQEAIEPNVTGLLTDFFDHDGLAKTVSDLLNDPEMRAKLGRNARKFAIENYDLQTVCLPKQLSWIEGL
jgi:glycosyltransferase involved in cell wall biosynthesis